MVIAIDAKLIDGQWLATTHGGTRPTDKELFAWAHEAQERGAGELLFTSMNHDGTRQGYPCDKRIRLNIWYIDHCSFLLDVKIFFMTIFKVLANADNENKGQTVQEQKIGEQGHAS